MDKAKEVAQLLTEASPPAIVELAGPADASAADAAAAMAGALGREVAPVPLPRAAWEETLAGAARGAAYAALLCEMYDGINAGQVRFSGEGAARRGHRTLDETVRGWPIADLQSYAGGKDKSFGRSGRLLTPKTRAGWYKVAPFDPETALAVFLEEIRSVQIGEACPLREQGGGRDRQRGAEHAADHQAKPRFACQLGHNERLGQAAGLVEL